MSKEHTKAAAGKNGRSTTGSAPSAEVKLTTEQRTKIRKVVIEEKKIPRLTKVNFDIKVGVRVPRTVHFYPVPEEIITIHPAWRSYRVIFGTNLSGDEETAQHARELHRLAREIHDAYPSLEVEKLLMSLDGSVETVG